jgi:hypothetical protein
MLGGRAPATSMAFCWPLLALEGRGGWGGARRCELLVDAEVVGRLGRASVASAYVSRQASGNLVARHLIGCWTSSQRCSIRKFCTMVDMPEEQNKKSVCMCKYFSGNPY